MFTTLSKNTPTQVFPWEYCEMFKNTNFEQHQPRVASVFMITNLIEPRMWKLILNHLIGNNCPEFRNGLLDSYFFKLNLGNDCLDFRFQAVIFKTILTQ